MMTPASMNGIRFPLTLALALASAAFSGCEKEARQPKALSTAEVSSGAPAAFKDAPAAVKQLAADIAEAIAKQDFTSAWDKLQTLNARPGLTDAQKEFVASGIASVGAEMQKSESTGNEAAQEALRVHRANK